MSRYRGCEVGYGEAHVITPVLVEPEDITIGVCTVVEGCDEVFEGGASVVRKFLEENLCLFFREGAHIGKICSFGLNLQFSREGV